MATHKLSKRTIDKLPTRAKSYIAYDSDLSGFGCRVTPTGAKSWIVEYRPHGGGRRAAKRRVTLGSIATLPPDSARNAAKEILARVRLGEDVAGEKAARRAAPTIGELVEKYMIEEIRPTRKASTAVLYETHFRRHILPELAGKRAIDVTRGEITKLHRNIGSTAPVTANRVVMLLSGLFSWASNVGLVPEDCKPTKGVSKYREEGRERYLTLDELGRLGDALREAETVGLPWDVDTNKVNTAEFYSAQLGNAPLSRVW